MRLLFELRLLLVYIFTGVEETSRKEIDCLGKVRMLSKIEALRNHSEKPCAKQNLRKSQEKRTLLLGCVGLYSDVSKV